MDRTQRVASLAGLALAAASLVGAVAATQGSGDITVSETPASAETVVVAPAVQTAAQSPASVYVTEATDGSSAGSLADVSASPEHDDYYEDDDHDGEYDDYGDDHHDDEEDDDHDD